MAYETLDITNPIKNVDVVALNRPHKLNAISIQMREELLDYLRTVKGTSVRVVIFTGTGRAFCSGADVGEFGDIFGPRADDAFETQQRFQELIQLIVNLDVPVITAVNGLAEGGGTAVAMMSDLRVAGEGATFGVGQVRRALVPDVGLTYLLPRLTGLGRALELMMLYERVDASQAHAFGMVNWVVPDDQVLDKALEVAGRLASGPRTSLKWIKRITYENLDRDINGALAAESVGQGICSDTAEFAESIRAFAEKREPQFQATDGVAE